MINKTHYFKHVLFLCGLLLFLPAFRSYQIFSLIGLGVYLAYLGLMYLGKDEIIRKFLYVPLAMWLFVGVMSHEYLLIMLTALFPSLLAQDYDNEDQPIFMRYMIWLAVGIALIMSPAGGFKQGKIVTIAPLIAALLSTLLLSTTVERITVKDDEQHSHENKDYTNKTCESEGHPEDNELLALQDEVLSSGLLNAVLRLDYQNFDRKETIRTTLKTLYESDKIKYIAYYRLNDEEQQYILEESAGRSPLKLQSHYPIGIGMVGQTYTSDNYIFATNLIEKEQDEVKKRLLCGMDSLLSIPVKTNGEHVGVLYLGFGKTTLAVQSMYVKLFNVAAERLGCELGKLNLHSHVERKSMTDKLTGLYNRQFFDDAIENEFAKVKNNGTFLSYVLLDIDYFKQMNDCHGHDFGDKVLMLAAQIFEDNIRSTDFACRTGGDEFSLILVGADKDETYAVVKRIRDQFTKAVDEHKLYAQKDGKPVKCTLSIGIAVAPHQKATSAKALVKMADKAVYYVKEHGKNSFCFVR